MFTIYSDRRSDSTMVSNLFIDEYMKNANDAQIKVYLYLLRMMGTQGTTSISDLADQFNHTEKDVLRSLRYWERRGLLDLTFGSENNLISICLRKPEDAAGRDSAFPGSVPAGSAGSVRNSGPDRGIAFPGSVPAGSAGSVRDSGPDRGIAGAVGNRTPEPDPGRVLAFPQSAETAAAADSPEMGKGTMKNDSADRGTAAMKNAGTDCGNERIGCPGGNESGKNGRERNESEALDRFRNSPDRTRLLFVIEQYIGKPLSMNEIRTVCHISEDLRFSDDLIDYLLQYCVDRGKKDFRYIAKVAESWAENGITTPAQAEASAEKTAADARAALSARRRGGHRPAASAQTAAQQQDSAAAGQPGAKRPRSTNSFNQFEQNSYDFDALENELLSVAGN
ncbi:MAG: DnaD domain protein [Eubacteriales bacterium]|nr:DnaD domain protein [Eubacteriales bacterium]